MWSFVVHAVRGGECKGGPRPRLRGDPSEAELPGPRLAGLRGWGGAIRRQEAPIVCRRCGIAERAWRVDAGTACEVSSVSMAMLSALAPRPSSPAIAAYAGGGSGLVEEARGARELKASSYAAGKRFP